MQQHQEINSSESESENETRPLLKGRISKAGCLKKLKSAVYYGGEIGFIALVTTTGTSPYILTTQGRPWWQIESSLTTNAGTNALSAKESWDYFEEGIKGQHSKKEMIAVVIPAAGAGLTYGIVSAVYQDGHLAKKLGWGGAAFIGNTFLFVFSLKMGAEKILRISQNFKDAIKIPISRLFISADTAQYHRDFRRLKTHVVRRLQQLERGLTDINWRSETINPSAPTSDIADNVISLMQLLAIQNKLEHKHYQDPTPSIFRHLLNAIILLTGMIAGGVLAVSTAGYACDNVQLFEEFGVPPYVSWPLGQVLTLPLYLLSILGGPALVERMFAFVENIITGHYPWPSYTKIGHPFLQVLKKVYTVGAPLASGVAAIGSGITALELMGECPETGIPLVTDIAENVAEHGTEFFNGYYFMLGLYAFAQLLQAMTANNKSTNFLQWEKTVKEIIKEVRLMGPAEFKIFMQNLLAKKMSPESESSSGDDTSLTTEAVRELTTQKQYFLNNKKMRTAWNRFSTFGIHEGPVSRDNTADKMKPRQTCYLIKMTSEPTDDSIKRFEEKEFYAQYEQNFYYVNQKLDEGEKITLLAHGTNNLTAIEISLGLNNLASDVPRMLTTQELEDIQKLTGHQRPATVDEPEEEAAGTGLRPS